MPDKFTVMDDPLQTVVNVGWRGAVEFDDRSRIVATLDDGLDTDRLLLAMWARVPSEVLAALAPGEMVPLIQFGPPAPTVSNRLRPEYETQRHSRLERSELGVGRNAAGRTYLGIRLVSAPFDLPQVVCPVAGFDDTLLVNGSGFSTPEQAAHSQINFGTTPAWAPVYSNFDVLIDGLYSGIGWWDIDANGQLNGILNTDATVTAGAHSVRFTIHYFQSDEPAIAAGTLKAQLNLSHRAQAALDARQSFENRVSPTAQPIIADAWNCILLAADVSRPVVLPAPPYHWEYDLTHTFATLAYDGYPEPKSLHRLALLVNGRDYSPTTIFFEYGYGSAGDVGEEDTRFMAVDRGGMLPGRLGGDGVFAGFIWDGSASQNYPGGVASCARFVPAAMRVGPWQFALSGFELGLPTHGPPPTQFAEATFSDETEFLIFGSLLGKSKPGTVELAAVSIWRDLAPDISAPQIRKLFIGDKGEFVPPKTAHDYFGSPAFFFNGGKQGFPRSKGSAPPHYPPDAFEAIDPSRDGSGISDYSPAPKTAGKVVGV